MGIFKKGPVDYASVIKVKEYSKNLDDLTFNDLKNIYEKSICKPVFISKDLGENKKIIEENFNLMRKNFKEFIDAMPNDFIKAVGNKKNKDLSNDDFFDKICGKELIGAVNDFCDKVTYYKDVFQLSMNAGQHIESNKGIQTPLNELKLDVEKRADKYIKKLNKNVGLAYFTLLEEAKNTATYLRNTWATNLKDVADNAKRSMLKLLGTLYDKRRLESALTQSMTSDFADKLRNQLYTWDVDIMPDTHAVRKGTITGPQMLQNYVFCKLLTSSLTSTMERLVNAKLYDKKVIEKAERLGELTHNINSVPYDSNGYMRDYYDLTIIIEILENYKKTNTIPKIAKMTPYVVKRLGGAKADAFLEVIFDEPTAIKQKDLCLDEIWFKKLDTIEKCKDIIPNSMKIIDYLKDCKNILNYVNNINDGMEIKDPWIIKRLNSYRLLEQRPNMNMRKQYTTEDFKQNDKKFRKLYETIKSKPKLCTTQDFINLTNYARYLKRQLEDGRSLVKLMNSKVKVADEMHISTALLKQKVLGIENILDRTDKTQKSGDMSPLRASISLMCVKIVYMLEKWEEFTEQLQKQIEYKLALCKTSIEILENPMKKW